MVVRFNSQNITFAGSAQSLFDIADAIHCVRRDPGERHFGCQRTPYHLNSERRLGGEGYSFRHMGRGKLSGIAGPALGQVQSPIDKGMAASRHIGGEYTDVAVRYLPAEPVY